MTFCEKQTSFQIVSAQDLHATDLSTLIYLYITTLLIFASKNPVFKTIFYLEEIM